MTSDDEILDKQKSQSTGSLVSETYFVWPFVGICLVFHDAS